MLLVTSIVVAGLSMLNGCKKSEQVPAPQTATGTTQGMQEHDHAAMTEQAATTAAAATEQTTCPVMGGAINKAVFIEYQGKKVYFCCPGCEDQFKEEPEKYIAKLPQFKQ
jgi:YHS domain-containing protein